MKIRNDFVSNSSSSSFIVAVNDGYDFYKMTDDIAKNCVSKVDFDCDEDYVSSIYNDNVANLRYCLKNNVLMFLGRCKGYADKYNDMDSLSEVVLNTRVIDYHLYDFRHNLEPDDDLRKRIDEVLNEVSRCRNTAYFSGIQTYHVNMYSITRQTVEITRKMLELGYKIEFDEWEDLDALEKRFENGERLYRIYLSHGGDGQDDRSVYGTAGWDSQFSEGLAVDHIYSECC